MLSAVPQKNSGKTDKWIEGTSKELHFVGPKKTKGFEIDAFECLGENTEKYMFFSINKDVRYK